MNLKTAGALGIVYVVWGSTYLAIRYAIEGFPPLLSGGLRFAAAAVLMLGYLAVRRAGRAARRPRPAHRCAGSGHPAARRGTAWSRWPSSGSTSGLVALFIAAVPLWS